MQVTPTGLTFPDATVQTTAYTGGGGGSYLPLAGGTMTGAIVFDGTSGQYISKGNFDTSRGGNYGISLVCSIGYEFNWQAGWLTTTNQGSVTPRPLYLDSLAGTTLRAWNSATDTGTEVSHTGITVQDGTYTNSFSAGSLYVSNLGVSSTLGAELLEFSNGQYYVTAGASEIRMFSPSVDPELAHPEVNLTSAALTFSLENEIPASIYAATGITFPDSTVQTTAGGPAVTNNNQLATTVTSTYTQYYIPFSDRNGIIVCQSGSPGVVLTDSSYGWTPGQQVLIVNNTSNSISVQASGATIVSVNSATYIVPNGVCAAVYIDTNLWVISGSLSN
jgi:hypothetical protein